MSTVVGSTVGSTFSAITDISDDHFFENDSLEDSTSLPLYGREEELLALTNAYDRVKKENSFEVVFVHGESGVGKTSVVMSLQEEVVRNQGFFCSAKYFQNIAVEAEPYAAIMAAFSDICDLTVQASDFNEGRRKEIKQVLHESADILMRSVSNITPFLEKECDFGVDEILIDSTSAKFKIACKTFLRAMPSKKHPIVIFLDDVQWMDQSTKKLLEILLQDSEIKNLMFILSYRDEEVDSIQEIISYENMLSAIDISVQNMDLKCTIEMVAAQLGSNSEEIYALGILISRKTRGNPFYINQFLSLIKKDKLLVYDEINCSWNFNTEKIEEETKVSDSIAKLLSCKVKRLDVGTQEMLKIASLIGYRFQEDMVIEITLDIFGKSTKKKISVEVTNESLRLSLGKAVDGGVLEKISSHYQFSHDKIQTAFRDLIGRSEQEKLHLKICTNYISQSDEASKYQTAVHLNLASEIHFERTGEIPIYMKEDAAAMVQINFDAAKYCESRSAFSSTIQFLRKGLDLLDDEEKWVNNFELSFEMTELLAKMEFINGNLDESKIANKEIFIRAKNTEMKIKALVLDIEMHSASCDFSGVIRTTRKVLRYFGIHVPRTVTILNLLRKMRKVRKLIDSKTDTEILSEQEIKDSQILTSLKILMLTCFVCSLQQKIVLGCYLALIATEISLKNGLSPYSSVALYMLGVTEIFLGNRERSYRMGKLALKLHSYIPCKGAGGSVVSASVFFSIFLKENIRKYFEMHTKPLNDAFKVGDINSALHCIVPFFNSMLWSGENLQLLERLMLDVRRRIHDFGQNIDENFRRINPMIQFVQNMQKQEEDWKDLTTMTGSYMNEKDYLSQYNPKSDAFCWILILCKMVLSYTFGFYEEAEKFVGQLSGVQYARLSYFCLPYNFYAGMLYYRLYETTHSRRFLRRARKFRKFMEKEHCLGNPNATSHLKILDVEELCLSSKNSLSEILEASNLAIWVQSKEGFAHLEALANEQASRIAQKFNNPSIAQKHYDQALHLYGYKWGAIAKYQMLLEKREQDLQVTTVQHGDIDNSREISFEKNIKLSVIKCDMDNYSANTKTVDVSME